MKQLLVGTSVVYTDATTPSGLTAGEIGIFTTDNVLITAANVNDHKGKPFYIAGFSTLGPRITKPIHKIYNHSPNVYAAPVKQVTTISGIALASSANKFTEYSVVVIDVSKGTSPSEDRVSSNSLGVFGTVANLVDDLVLRINGNPRSIVVASRSTNDLVLTAKEFDNRFRVSVQANLENATITYTTAWSPGVGYGPRVQEIENDFLVYEGYRARLDRRYPQPALQSSAASNYDIIVVDWIYTASNKSGMDALYNRDLKVILAIVAGASQYTTINTILSELKSQVGPQGPPAPGP